MCYNVAGLKYNQLKYAIRMGASDKVIQQLKDKYEELRKIYDIPKYYANGFAMPNLLVHTKEHKQLPTVMRWRYIPEYVTNNESLNSFIRRYTTLNVQSERMWTSPMFKKAAIHRRCIIPVSGYYEYFHLNKKKYPFLIQHKKNEALLLGGIYNQWTNQDTGESHQSVGILTTSPNELSKHIHNNPKAKSGPRMPLIIPEGSENLWLSEVNNITDLEEIKSLLKPYPDEALTYQTVPTLTGKTGAGDTEIAQQKKEYPELSQLHWYNY